MASQKPPFDNRKQGLIRALLYPVLFEKRPINGVERVLSVVVDRKALGATSADYQEAIRSALASEVPLGAFGSENHSEQAIREFLEEIANHLSRTRNKSEPMGGAM